MHSPQSVSSRDTHTHTMCQNSSVMCLTPPLMSAHSSICQLQKQEVNSAAVMTISPAVSKTDTPFTFQYDYEYERVQKKAAATPVPSLIDSWLSMESANSQMCTCGQMQLPVCVFLSA